MYHAFNFSDVLAGLAESARQAEDVLDSTIFGLARGEARRPWPARRAPVAPAFA